MGDKQRFGLKNKLLFCQKMNKMLCIKELYKHSIFICFKYFQKKFVFFEDFLLLLGSSKKNLDIVLFLLEILQQQVIHNFF